MHVVVALAQLVVLVVKAAHVSVFTCGVSARSAAYGTSHAAHGGTCGFVRVLRLEHPVVRTPCLRVWRSGRVIAARRALCCLSTESEVAWSGSTRDAV